LLSSSPTAQAGKNWAFFRWNADARAGDQRLAEPTQDWRPGHRVIAQRKTADGQLLAEGG